MPLLEMRDISKRFGSVQALEGVSLELEAGEIHALLGENGAGKTTLMNILYGLIRPDTGEVFLEGRPVRFRSPQDALRARIGMVHQHFMLVPPLTVAENVWLGDRKRYPFLFRRRDAVEATRRLVERFGLKVDPERRIEELSVGVQQRVEILKCLARDARILILDEPTAVLTPQEVEELGAVLRGLRNEGRSVIFISHKLKEVLELCDRVTVLRAGRNVGTLPIQEVTEKRLSEMMVGRELEPPPPRARVSDQAPVVLELKRLSVRDDRGAMAVRELSLKVRAGEIFGIAGIDGNGQAELLDALAGVRSPFEGSVRLAGEEIGTTSARQRAALGLAVITDDRQRKGLVLELPVAENLILKRHRSAPFARGGWLLREEIARYAEEKRRQYDIRAASLWVPAKTLSGGNQQKVVVAREMDLLGQALVAMNPTRGLDVGATEFVHRTLLEARSRGAAILLISTELDEVLLLSDRVGVLHRGRLFFVPPERTNRVEIGRLMLGEGEAA
ncbi:MAG: ABC transporter ATP-binding protein [Candidatus Poribacteria bacterium]|nr:MAG: ABC transporter ATP-binding protein [Candidatus Poribacteria bacterium]